MGKIIILDELTSNQIAAGEVVERPSSVVKELVENSLDAGATAITVEIEKGGISYLRITDNGSGIEEDDVEIAFERHSTSKIRRASDLDQIASFGFRGEALASVASVSIVELITKTKDSETGTKLTVKAGKILEKSEAGCQNGTTIIVKDLFFNTPARYKFLKKDTTEAGYIEDIMTRLALANPDIAFKYINHGKTIIQTSGNDDIVSAVYSVFGKDIAKNVIEINYEQDGYKLEGVIGNPQIARANRTNQIFFVNKRYIKNKTMIAACEEAFKTLLPIGKYPFLVLNLTLNPSLVDVNVHPTKMEVRFSNESEIFRVFYNGVKSGLFKQELTPTVNLESKSERNIQPTTTYNHTNITPDVIKEESKKLELNVPGMIKHDITSPAIQSHTDNRLTTIQNPIQQPAVIQKQFEHPTIYQKPEQSISIQKQIEQLVVYQKPEQQMTSHNLFNPNEDKPKEIVYKFVGIAFQTFIIIEYEGQLYIIDQHAAHERIMFERLKDSYYKKEKMSQILLVPTVVELCNSDMVAYKENMQMFEDCGFMIEDFGEGSLKIYGIPNIYSSTDVKDLFLEMIDQLVDMTKGITSKKEDDFIHRLACKSAVKANMVVEPKEVNGLIKQLLSLENPFTCPHGRPLAIKFSRYELEKKFLRT